MKENHWGNPLNTISRHSEIVNSPLEKILYFKGENHTFNKADGILHGRIL